MDQVPVAWGLGADFLVACVGEFLLAGGDVGAGAGDLGRGILGVG